MHAFQHLEMTALLAGLAPNFLRGRARRQQIGHDVDDYFAAKEYWLNSRLRFDRWGCQLAKYRELSGSSQGVSVFREGKASRRDGWWAITPVIQEVLLSEVLTSCVSRLAESLAQLGHATDLLPLSQRVSEAHQETRRRCLHLMVFGVGLPVERAVELNRVRQEAEQFQQALLPFFTTDTVGEVRGVKMSFLIAQSVFHQTTKHCKVLWTGEQVLPTGTQKFRRACSRSLKVKILTAGAFSRVLEKH